MLPVLYGLADRDRYVKGGSFGCPLCGERKYCTHRKIESWFTIFFIPIFPGEIREEYVKCQDCHHSFRLPGFVPFFPKGGYLPSDLRAELYAGAPIEEVEKRLIASGVDQETASPLIWSLAGDARKFCPTCDLSYQGHVTNCRKCDRILLKIPPKKPGFDPIDGF